LDHRPRRGRDAGLDLFGGHLDRAGVSGVQVERKRLVVRLQLHERGAVVSSRGAFGLPDDESGVAIRCSSKLDRFYHWRHDGAMGVEWIRQRAGLGSVMGQRECSVPSLPLRLHHAERGRAVRRV